MRRRLALRIRRRGVWSIGAATALSAFLGWAALVVAARTLGTSGYAEFALFWGFFFAVGGTCAGLQQEVARSVTAGGHEDTTRDRRSGTSAVGGPVMIAVGLMLLAVAFSPWWGDRLLGRHWIPVLAILVLGVTVLVAYTSVNGVLAGRGQWRSMAGLMSAEPALRLVGVAGATAVGGSAPLLMAAIGLGPFAVLAFLPHPPVRAALSARLGDGFSEVARKSVILMAANGCSAMLITGFPVLLKVTSHGQIPGASTGILLATVMVTRAPLLLPLNGYRLAILNYFIRSRLSLVRRVATVAAAILGVAVLGAGLAALVGPQLIAVVLGGEFRPSRGLTAGLTFSAGLIALLSVTTMGLVSIERHTAATLGWFAALLATVAVLALPLALDLRAVVALVGGAVAGLSVHVAVLGPAIGNPRATMARRL